MVKQLRAEFDYHRKSTNSVVKEIQTEADKNRRLTDEVSYSIKHIRESIDQMGTTMTNFINVMNNQNERINKDFKEQDKEIADQRKSVDDFINKGVGQDSKRRFVVSVLQVVSGIIIAALTIWATGKI